MISPDAAIHSPSEDRLGRAEFAKALASSILGFERPDSFVIGIHGKWGTGKTSVVNLCAEALEELNRGLPLTKRVSILWFNPWNFADQGHLVLQFLRQFTAHLRQFEKQHRRIFKKVVETLDDYSSALAPPIQEVRIGRILSGTIQAGLKALGAGKDPDSLYRTVQKQLEELKRKIVVVIDDIDRLSAGEIRQIFQLVKLTGRFPYVIYLLAFDKERVAHALTEAGAESGEEYLEKIVQVSFDLPPIQESTLTDFITSGLDDLLRRYPPAHFDMHRFGNVFHAGFRKSFQTLRDVRRFLNGLEFRMALVSREVNGVDLIGLECIRTFYPATYEVIKANKDVFAGHVDYDTRQKGPDAFRKTVDSLLESTGEADDVRDLLVELFPKIEYAYGHVSYGPDSETEWEKTHGLGTTRFFEFYFQLRVPSGDVSVADIEGALQLLPDHSLFAGKLRDFVRSKRLENALSSIRHRLESLSAEKLRAILAALVEIGDSVEHRGRSLLGIVSEFSHVRWAIFDVLDKLRTGERFGHLEEVLRETNGVGTTVDLIVYLDELRSKRKDRYTDLTDECLQRMKACAVEKIRSCAAKSALLNSPELPFTLAWWGRWGDPTQPKEYAMGLLGIPNKLSACLSQFIYEQHSAGLGDRVARVKKKLSARALAEFFDLGKLSETLEQADHMNVPNAGLETLRFVKEQLAKMREKGLTPEQFDNVIFGD